MDDHEESSANTETTPLLPDAPYDAPKQRPYAFAAICLFTFISVFGSLLFYVPNLEVYRFIICQSYYADSGDVNLISLVGDFNGAVNDKCLIDDISKKVAQFNGLVQGVESFFALFVVLFYGRMADAYGRKPPMYICLGAICINVLWAIFVIGKAGTWKIEALLFGSVVSGLGGAAAVLKMLVFSIVCDCQSGGARLVAMSYLMANFLLAASAGPAVGSILLSRGLLWPLWGGFASFSLATFIFFWIPETHPQLHAKASPVEMTVENTPARPVKGLSSLVRAVLEPIENSVGALGMFGRGRNFPVLGFISFTFAANLWAIFVVLQFLGHQFKWDNGTVGYFFSAFNGCKIVVLLVLLPLLTKFLLARATSEKADLMIVQFSLLCDGLAYIGYGLVSSSALLPPVVMLQAMAAGGGASLKVLISNLVPPEEIGSLFAAFSVVDGIGDLITPPIFAAIYSSTLSTYAGAVFLVVGAFYLLGLLVSSLIRIRDAEDHVVDETVEPGLSI